MAYQKIQEESSTAIYFTGVTRKEEYIMLQVVGDQDLPQVNFRIKMRTPLGKLKRAYSNRLGVPVALLRFLFNGRWINGDETPRKLELENNDVIEVHQEQIGGMI